MLANLSKLVKKEFEPQNLLCWLVLLLPLGTAKHFVGSYSYVNGYLVDYLVPAFYVSEFLVWGVTLSFFVRLRRTRKFPTAPATLRLRGGRGLLTSFAVLGFLLANFYQAGNPVAWAYRAYRLLEAGLFFIATTGLLKDKAILRRFTAFFAGGVLWASLLGLIQFVKQAPLFGYLPLGESQSQLYNPAVAKVELFGKLLVRAYSGFPHPNILAGYLVVGVLLTLETLVSSRKFPRFLRLLTTAAPMVGLLALLATFSRTGVLALGVGVFLTLETLVSSRKFPKRLRLLRFPRLLTSFAGLVLVVVALAVTPRFSESLAERLVLAKLAFKVWREAPLWGTGLNSFSKFASLFKFQPVHNIFLLSLAETGILGTALFLGFLGQLARKLVFPAGVIFVALLIFGSLDHFLLTTYQGITLFSLTLGVAFAYTKNNG